MRCPFAVAMAAALLACSAHAQQQYPMRPIKVVVTLAPGSQPDLVARLVAERMQASLGQPVIVENRPGAEGTIGTEYVAKSAPDGYTLLYALGGALTVVPALYGDRVRYDSEKDFAPITQTVRTTFFVTTSKAVPAEDLKQLVAYAKSNARSTAFGHVAGVPYLMALLLKQATSPDVGLVAYKGTTEVVTDLLAGRIQAGLTSLPGAQQQIKAGKLNALAVLSRSRSDLMPEVPTAREEGYPELDGDTWNGLLARAGTAPEVIERLHREVTQILSLPDVRERLHSAGVEIRTSDPQSLAQLIREDKARWARIVRDFRVTPDN